jgi:hypothetical protein
VTARSTGSTALAALLLAACISPKAGGPPPQCELDADCNTAAGEVCGEGICWGDPPAGDYAAVIGPPTMLRSDLIATEVPSLSIAPDGTIADLVVHAPAMLTGHVRMACPSELPLCTSPVPVPATISVARTSRFGGGNDFRTAAAAEMTADGSGFAIPVPAMREDDPPYVLTVTPASFVEADDATIDPAALAPPLRLEVRPGDDITGLELLLGGDGPRLVVGKVLDGAGRGIARARLTAYGRWDASLPLERVGTLATTRSDGSFRLLVAGRAKPVIDIVVQPPEGAVAPTLRLGDIDAGDPYRDLGELRLPSFPVPTTFRIPVAGFDPSGAPRPVVGATVTVSAVIDDGVGSGDAVATFEVATTTGPGGDALLSLIPGSPTATRTYQMRINPPAESPFAAIYERTLVVGASGGVLQQVRLPKRVPITGVVRDADGAPVEGVTVVAKPALRFTWTLDDTTQVLLEGIQPAAQVTAEDGSFVVFVDPDVAGEPASYDLECEPPTGALLPRWTAVDVDAGASEQTIGLPAAAYVHGRVVDGETNGVADAEVRIFQASTEVDSCAAGPYRPGGGCEVPASLLALGRSDGDGWVRLVLPRTAP